VSKLPKVLGEQPFVLPGSSNIEKVAGIAENELMSANLN
jgi:hypothetical protein